MRWTLSSLFALFTRLSYGLLGCSGAPRGLADVERPPGFVDPGLKATGASEVHQLWRGSALAGARFTLPPSSLPTGFTASARVPIPMEAAPVKTRRATKLYRGDSPFKATVEEEGRVSAPPGMHLFVGDTELQYHANLVGPTWRIAGDKLLVAWAGDPLPQVSIAYPEVEREVRRRDFATAGLSASAFVEHELTLDARTRDGVLLPAPAVGEWDLTLPTGDVTFEAWLALSPLPLQTLASDGAYAKLEVVADGQATEVDRAFVGPRDQFAEWRADLSRWAGKTVTVRISTEAYGPPDYDYVFVGNPTVWGAPSGPVRRVVVIGLDTTRPDHFGFFGYDRDPTPELDAVAASSVVFDHTWSPAPRTRPSFRTAFTGRRPLDAVGAENLAAVFQDHGFLTAGIVANVHLQPRFEFDEGFDDWWYDGQAKADAQVERALGFLGRYPDRDTFLFLHLMDPHLFYNAPRSYKEMYVTDPDPDLPNTFTRWEVYGWDKAGLLDERRKDHIVARYDAELRFMSEQLGRLFDGLDRLPGRSLVVLHSDHGEEFWEHGGFEHNHTLFDETTRTLLWFRSGPGQARGKRVSTPVTLADIAPTLYELAGLTDTPPVDGVSLVPLLLGDGASGAAPVDWDARPLGVAHLRYGLEKWGVVVHGHKYVLSTASGEEELYDLVTDPTESHSVAPSIDLAPYRAALADAHGMQVGRGWRIRVDLYDTAAAVPYRVTLPVPALAAGVVDPEATIENPANQAWGEPPDRTPADIGEVTLSDDRRTLTFTPGPKPLAGLLYVLFDADVDPTAATLLRDTYPLTTVATTGKLRWSAGRNHIDIVPGTVVVPPLGEGARMRALGGPEHDLEAERQLLCDLGYLKCDEPEPGKGSKGKAKAGKAGPHGDGDGGDDGALDDDGAGLPPD